MSTKTPLVLPDLNPEWKTPKDEVPAEERILTSVMVLYVVEGKLFYGYRHTNCHWYGQEWPEHGYRRDHIHKDREVSCWTYLRLEFLQQHQRERVITL